MYEVLSTSLRIVMTVMAKLRKGYFQPEIFTPSKLKITIDSVVSMVQKKNLAYVLAFPDMTLYNDMKLCFLW